MGGICDKHGHLLTSRQKTYNFLAQKWRAGEVGRWGRIGEVGRWAGTAGYGRLAGWQVGQSRCEYRWRVGVGVVCTLGNVRAMGYPEVLGSRLGTSKS